MRFVKSFICVTSLAFGSAAYAQDQTPPEGTTPPPAATMTAPGTILISKILVPETEMPKTAGQVTMVLERKDVNILDAASRGVADGLFLALNVAAMLIAFIALIHLADGLLGRE